jgi:glycosyltransferase involved in cell wall biosynthesis
LKVDAVPRVSNKLDSKMASQRSSVPLVSVLMASYNHARFIRQAIESVWNQTHPNMELIVVDDGSEDRSVEIIEELQARSPIPMHVEVQENRGPAATFNRALQSAAGDWICILASDDFYSPGFVERQLAEATGSSRDAIVVHSNAYLVEADGRVTGTLDGISEAVPLRGQAFELLVNGGGRLLPCTMFLRRQLLLDAGAFDPEMIAEDCDLHLRLARAAEFHYVEDPIFYSRYTPDSLGKKPWLWGDGIIKALAKHEDVLGDRLPGLLAKASSNICDHCFEYGEWAHGLRWGGRALGHAPGIGARTRVAGHLAHRITRAATRNIAYRLFGRDRLVRLKRKLQRA